MRDEKTKHTDEVYGRPYMRGVRWEGEEEVWGFWRLGVVDVDLEN